MDDRIKERVNIWLAKDENGNLVNILEAEQGKDYYCLECGEILRARALTSEKVTPHFYHLNNSNCGGGINNESEIHKYFKANLFHVNDTFVIGGKEYKVTYVEEEHLFLNEFGTTKDYKPDIALRVKNLENGKVSTICIELYHTNAKDKKEYYDRWKFFSERGDFRAVFEIDLNQLKFNCDCWVAMKLAKILFPSKDYEIYRRIFQNDKKNKEYDTAIYNLENELTRLEEQYNKELEGAKKTIEYRNSYYEKELNKKIEKIKEEYRPEFEEINKEYNLEFEKLKKEFNLRLEELSKEINSKLKELKGRCKSKADRLKEQGNPRIEEARKECNSKIEKVEEEVYGNIEVEYKSPINVLKQRVEELENEKNESNKKFNKELLAKYSKEEIKKALKKYGKNN